MLANHLKSYFKNHKLDIYSVVFLFFLTVIYFTGLLFNNKVLYPAPDIAGQYLEWRSFLVDQILHQHAIPLWNPYEYAGAPFIGNPLSAIFYPPNIIFFFMDIGQAFKYLFFFNVFFFGVFSYLYARLVIRSRLPSIFSSIIMMFNGVIVARINAGHVSNVDVLVWFPLLLYFIEQSIRKESLKFVAFVGIVVGLTTLAGHIQVAFYSLFAGFLYFLIRGISEYIGDKNIIVFLRRLLFFSAGYLLGFCLASVQLLPVLEFGQLSTRSIVSYEFATNFSIPIIQSVELFLPRIFGQPQLHFSWGRGSFTEFSAYSGVLAYVFAVASFFYAKNKITFTFGIFFLFSYLFVLGDYGPIFHLFYYYVPGFNHFRIPATMFFVFSFSISILAGIGLSGIYSLISKKKTTLKYFNAVLIVLVCILGVIIEVILIDQSVIAFFIKEIISKKFEIQNVVLFSQLLKTDLLVSFVSLVVFVSVLHVKSFKKYFQVIVIGVVTVDLFFFGFPLLTTSNSYIDQNEENIIKKIDVKNFRVIDLANINPLILQRENGKQVRSYSPALLSNFRDYLWSAGTHPDQPYEPYVSLDVITHYNILKLLNVGYIISNKEIKNSNIIKIDHQKDLFLYKIYDTYPKAFTVVHAEQDQDKNILEKLKSDSFQPRKTIFFNSKYPSYENKEYQSRNVIVKEKTANIITMSTISPQNEYLFTSEIWYPGWKVYVNGKEKNVLKADYIFRAVKLSKGNNEIEFIYDPVSFRVGKYGSLLGVVISILILLPRKRKLIKTGVSV